MPHPFVYLVRYNKLVIVHCTYHSAEADGMLHFISLSVHLHGISSKSEQGFVRYGADTKTVHATFDLDQAMGQV